STLQKFRTTAPLAVPKGARLSRLSSNAGSLRLARKKTHAVKELARGRCRSHPARHEPPTGFHSIHAPPGVWPEHGAGSRLRIDCHDIGRPNARGIFSREDGGAGW